MEINVNKFLHTCGAFSKQTKELVVYQTSIHHLISFIKTWRYKLIDQNKIVLSLIWLKEYSFEFVSRKIADIMYCG